MKILAKVIKHNYLKKNVSGGQKVFVNTCNVEMENHLVPNWLTRTADHGGSAVLFTTHNLISQAQNNIRVSFT
jgi:hypothetical protein